MAGVRPVYDDDDNDNNDDDENSDADDKNNDADDEINDAAGENNDADGAKKWHFGRRKIIPRPLFNASIPPKWCLFCAFSTIGWVLRQF